MKLILFIVDVHPLLAQYFPTTTYSCDYIQSIPSTNTTITLPNWTCNDLNYTTFDFSRFTDLEYLEIGSDSFGYVDTFIIDGLNNLTTLKIGQNSFTVNKNGNSEEVESKSFHIINCESLESIDIDSYSFTDFAGEFELVNLPSLQSIRIGDTDSWNSYNFYYSSFVLRGFKLKHFLFTRSS